MNKIGIDDLNMYFEYCGTNLSQTELETFTKKVNHNGNYIDFKTISRGLLKASHESQFDPYEIVAFVLLDCLPGGNKSVNTEVSITDLSKYFFTPNGEYFSKEDLKEFINEILQIQGKANKIEIGRIASMVRNNLKGFPK